MENRFYVVRVKFLKDGTQKKSELMDYATEIQARQKLYSNLATDMADDTLQGSMCTVLNSIGGEVDREYWMLPEIPE